MGGGRIEHRRGCLNGRKGAAQASALQAPADVRRAEIPPARWRWGVARFPGDDVEVDRHAGHTKYHDSRIHDCDYRAEQDARSCRTPTPVRVYLFYLD